jgi:predicted RND superfamily exporter protein
MIDHPLNPFLRFPRTVCAIFASLLAGSLFFAGRLVVSGDAEALLAADERAASSYAKVREALQNETVIVVDMMLDDVFAPAGIAEIAAASEAFMELPGLVDVKSLTHSYKPVRDRFSFKGYCRRNNWCLRRY